MGYFLRPGLTFCRLSGRLIFLDRPADRYFGLADPLERALAGMIDTGSADPDRTAALVERGILVECPGTDTLIAPIDRPALRYSLLSGSPVTTSLATILPAASRQLASRLLIRIAGLDRALGRFERLSRVARATAPSELEHARRVAAHHQAAGMLAGAHERCLPNAHAIGCELARAGLAARLVFGVKLRPFEAHCWVELGDAVVNDRLDLVQTYTPILVV